MKQRNGKKPTMRIKNKNIMKINYNKIKNRGSVGSEKHPADNLLKKSLGV